MIKYLHLRWQVYCFELKQLLASLQQLMTFLLLMLYLALPILILTPLLCLSIIADVNISLFERVIYQWFYFALLYLLIRIQRKAILATKYQYYLATIPQLPGSKKLAAIGLTCIAGNLLLLAPLALLMYLPSWQALLVNMHFVSFGAATIVIAWLAVNKQRFAWFSLVLLPVGFLLAASLSIFTAATMNFVMLMAMILSSFIRIRSPFNAENLTLRHYWQLRLLAFKDKPSNAVFRLVSCVLLVVVLAYVQFQVQQTAVSAVQVFFCWLVAIILGSHQFDNEAFYKKYGYYLASLFVEKKVRYIIDALPMLVVSVTVALLLILSLSFSYFTLALLPLGCLLTQLSVNKFQRNFFVLPSLAFAILLALILF